MEDLAQPALGAERPRESADLLSIGGFRVAGASVVGRSHTHQGRPRDDAFALAANRDASPPWWFAAVADGAGSRPLSRFGAIAATTAAAAQAREQLEGKRPPREVMIAAVEAARAAQIDCATSRIISVSELACTLLCIACIVEDSQLTVVTFQVGDGLIARCDGNGLLRPIAEADDQVPGETLFLDMVSDVGPRIRIEQHSKPPHGFLLATDGVADDLIPLAENGPILAAELDRIVTIDADAGPRVEELLDYDKRGSFDDRTLVIAWRGREV